MTIKAYQEAEQARLKKGHRSALHFSWFFAALGLIVWPGLFWVAGACFLMWLILFIPDRPKAKPRRFTSIRGPRPAPELIPLHKKDRHLKEAAEWSREYLRLLNETRRAK